MKVRAPEHDVDAEVNSIRERMSESPGHTIKQQVWMAIL